GTPAYMPPEQAQGRNEVVSERSDIFAVGAILFELACGKAPIAANSALEAKDKAADANYLSLREYAPRCSQEFRSIIERAMAYNPGDRYQTCDALAEDLRALRSGGRVWAHRYSRFEQLLRFVRRRKRELIAATAMVAIGAGVWIWQEVEQQRAFDHELTQRKLAFSDLQAGLRGDDLLQELKAALGHFDTSAQDVGRSFSETEIAAHSELLSAASEEIARSERMLAAARVSISGQAIALLDASEESRYARSVRELRAISSRFAAVTRSYGLAETMLSGFAESDPERIKGMALIQEERQALLLYRAARIRHALQDISEGDGLARLGRDKDAPSYQDYLFEIASFRETQTVEIFAERLAWYAKREREAGEGAVYTRAEGEELAFIFELLPHLGRDDLALAALKPILSDSMNAQVLEGAGLCVLQLEGEEATLAFMNFFLAKVKHAPQMKHRFTEPFQKRSIPPHLLENPEHSLLIASICSDLAWPEVGLPIAEKHFAASPFDEGALRAYVPLLAQANRYKDIVSALESYNDEAENPLSEFALPLGNAYTQLGEVKDARRELEFYVKENGWDVSARVGFFLLERKESNVKGAIDHLYDAIRIEPNNDQVQILLAAQLNHSGFQTEAIVALEKAISINPNSRNALTNLAILYQNEGRYQAAIEMARRSLRIDPAQPKLRLGLAKALYNTQEFQAALIEL
ncbi:MAG: tetratricopeptide repeat protein, partial [Planctomycetes bacterium]|nr:tetratricopeptide repeat protein [Planctomycetota bacterium]